MGNEVKPVEICIEESEVVKRYPITEAIELVRCKTSIFFHSTGFFVVSKPTLANNFKGGALFEMLQWYCDYQDERDNYSEEDKERYDTLCGLIVNILTLPLDVFTNIDLTIDIADYILKKRNEYYENLFKESSVEKEETLQDTLDNVAYEAEVAVQEQLAKELGELAKKKKDADKRTS